MTRRSDGVALRIADYVKNRGDYGVDYVKSVIFAHITNESEYV